MDITEIGNKIKNRRAALNMTQKELAKAMNVSNQLISKWETGESVPSLEYLDALCKALGVDYSYFMESGGGEAASPSPAPAKPRGKSRWSWKWFALVLTALWVAGFVAGFVALTVYVFVPAASKTRYIEEIQAAYERYFDLGYYSINMKTEKDGDVVDDYLYEGYFDGNGNPAVHDTRTNRTVKDGIATYDFLENYKYRYSSTKTYSALDELALAHIYPDGDEDELINEDFGDIRYIRKVKGGYYLEMKDEYFTDELSGTQKKNFKLTDKIKGKIEIRDGLLGSMSVTVKYLNKPDNERFTLCASFTFIAEQPVIEHVNLEGRIWNGSFIDDVWYPPQTSDDPVIDNTPKCEELLSVEEFVSRLSDGKAKKLGLDYAFNQRVLYNELKDGGDCYYYADANKAVILNKTDLSVKTTITLASSDTAVTDVYVFNGNVYWTKYLGYTTRLYVRNVSSGKEETLFNYDGGDITYYGRYALYYGALPDMYHTAYIVCDLTTRQEYELKNIDAMFIDSEGNVYGKRLINGEYSLIVYRDGIAYLLKGNDFYSKWSSDYSYSYFNEGDSVFTCENDTVYRYEKGALKEQFKTSDPRAKENYTALKQGYCLMNTSGSVASPVIFDADGKERKFENCKLKYEKGIGIP